VSSNLPVTTGGGAVVSLPAGDVIPAGDVSREVGATNDVRLAWTETPPAVREILRDLIIDGIPEQVIDKCLAVIHDWAPALSAATTWESKSRVADSIRDQLIGKGLLTVEQIDQIRPILRRLSLPKIVTADGVKRRIAEIEAWMGARRGSAEYKLYYEDPLVQEEYRELQRRRP